MDTSPKCYLCFESMNKNVPLLRCKHYCCPKCYCLQKANNIYKCQICNGKLVRGRKTIF